MKKKIARAAKAKTPARPFPPLDEIRAAVTRLEADRNVFVEKFEVREPVKHDLSKLPRDWQAFYSACDGFVLRWRHRDSRRDQDWLAAAGKTFDSLRPATKLPDVWELDHQITAFVDIPPFARIAKNKYWSDWVQSIARTDAADATIKVDGKSMPFVDANRLVRPFDVFYPSEHVFVRTDNWQLLLGSDSNAELEFKNALDLSTYLTLVATTYGVNAWRSRFFRARGKLKRKVLLSDLESVLLDDYEPSAADVEATTKTSTFWTAIKAPKNADQKHDAWQKIEKKLDKLSPEKIEDITRGFFRERTPKQLHPYEDEFLGWLRFRPMLANVPLTVEVVDAALARMDTYRGEAEYPTSGFYLCKDNEPGNAQVRLRLSSLTLPESCWYAAIAYAIELGIRLDEEGRKRLQAAIKANKHLPGMVELYELLLKHGTSLKPFPD